jgi:hypothetical protein
MRKITLILFWSLLAGGVGAADAQGASRFDEYDQNADGQLTPEEFATSRIFRHAERAQQGLPLRNVGEQEQFEAVDLDGDGSVSPEEFASHQSERRRGR